MLERSQMCYELKERLIHLDCVVLYTQNCFSGVSNLFYCYHSLRIVFISREVLQCGRAMCVSLTSILFVNRSLEG